MISCSLVFFHLCKALFPGCLQFSGNFVDGQSNSKYRDGAPLSLHTSQLANQARVYCIHLIKRHAIYQIICDSIAAFYLRAAFI